MGKAGEIGWVGRRLVGRRGDGGWLGRRGFVFFSFPPAGHFGPSAITCQSSHSKGSLEAVPLPFSGCHSLSENLEGPTRRNQIAGKKGECQ